MSAVEPADPENRGGIYVDAAVALEASKSLADVFTPEGDAGVITFLSTRQGVRGAYVNGRLVDEWFPLSDLTCPNP